MDRNKIYETVIHHQNELWQCNGTSIVHVFFYVFDVCWFHLIHITHAISTNSWNPHKYLFVCSCCCCSCFFFVSSEDNDTKYIYRRDFFLIITMAIVRHWNIPNETLPFAWKSWLNKKKIGLFDVTILIAVHNGRSQSMTIYLYIRIYVQFYT